MVGARKLFAIVTVVLIVCLIGIYTSRVEVPLWTLQFTFYAFMTAFFGFMFTIIRDYLNEREAKRFDEKKALESLKNEYERCAWAINNNIEKSIEKNELTNFKAQVSQSWVKGNAKISEEIERQVQEYNEKLELYDVLCRASKPQIKSIIEKRVKEKFPNTLKKKVRLDKLLQRDYVMARYFDGEKVTDSWFRQEHPQGLKEIIKVLDETEKDELDTLFRELNGFVKNDVVLQRFIKEKKELIKHGKKTIENLQTEINSLNEKLKRYSNLRLETLEFPSEDEPYE